MLRGKIFKSLIIGTLFCGVAVAIGASVLWQPIVVSVLGADPPATCVNPPQDGSCYDQTGTVYCLPTGYSNMEWDEIEALSLSDYNLCKDESNVSLPTASRDIVRDVFEEEVRDCRTVSSLLFSEGGDFNTADDFVIDRNADSIVDCEDVELFINHSADCDERTLTVPQKKSLITKFLNEVDADSTFPDKDVCFGLRECAEAIVAESITNTEFADFQTDAGCDDLTCTTDETQLKEGEGDFVTGGCCSETDANAPQCQMMSDGNGDVIAAETDLSVSLTGTDWLMERVYTSDPDYISSCEGPSKWSIASFGEANFASGSPDTVTLQGNARSKITVPLSGGSPYSLPGSTSQTLESTSVTIDGDQYPIYRHSEPGQWQTDYLRDNEVGETGGSWVDVDDDLIGKIIQTRDTYGNIHTYEWAIHGSTTTAARLNRIYFNGVDESDASAMAVFNYEGTSASPNHGRLELVQIFRDLGGTPQVLTQYVEYTYMDDTDTNLSDDLGDDGDLIQVARFTRVDPAPTTTDATYRVQITQYRYHRGTGGSSGVPDISNTRYTWTGSDHQMKMVIEPEQIEFAAQRYNDANPGTKTHKEFADFLLGKKDDFNVFDEGSDDILVVDLASRVFEEYDTVGADKRLETQYIISACGCGGGGTQGKKLAYTYYDYTGGNTIKVDEDFLDGSSFSDYRTVYYDMEDKGSDNIPYLATMAIEEPITDREWVTHYDYDTDRNVQSVFTPASVNSYTESSGTAPTVNLHASTGLVHVYNYTSDNRLAKKYVSQGDPNIVSDDCTDCTIVEEYIYGDADGAGTDWTTSNSRDYLLAQVKRSRTDNNPTAADDIEVTNFFYGFHTNCTTSEDIAWTETEVEAELVAENGPGGTYSSYELFDTDGYRIWSLAADKCVTKYEYDDDGTGNNDTGGLIKVIRNADPSADSLPSSHGNGSCSLSTSGFGRHSDGGSLTTQYTLDILGRVRESITPGNVHTYTLREMRAFPGRNELDYYAVITLPHELLDSQQSVLGYDGPANVTWYNADNDLIGSSDFEIGANGYDLASDTSDYKRLFADYDVDYADDTTELAKQHVLHDVSGLVNETRVWHDVETSTAHYSTTYTYDGLGRTDEITNANGTITKYSYDVLNRVKSVKTGTSAGNLELASESFYDDEEDTSSNVGNSNVTMVRQHVNTSASNDRETLFTYDWRDRPIAVQNPDKPFHEAIGYDNLDRITEQALYDFASVQGTPPSDPSTNAANRGQYTKIQYSQRGSTHKQQSAIDPSQTSPTFIETNTWFDQVGQAVGIWSPNEAMQKITYDGLGRPSIIYTTDRRSDADPGASGNHGHVYDATAFAAKVSNDVVLEQMEYSYIEDSASAHAGMMELATTRMRTHLATDDDDGDLADFDGVGGNPAANKVIATYVANFYDDADRITHVANYGTNSTSGFVHSGSAPTITQGSPPTGAELVSETTYNTRGLEDTTTSPDGDMMKYFYDDMYRQIAVVENYQDGQTPLVDVAWDADGIETGPPAVGRWQVTQGLDAANPEEDRVTSTVYDGLSNTIFYVAHLPKSGGGEEVQVTQYVYDVPKGTLAGESGIASKDLLYKVIYPDESDGVIVSTDAATDYTVTHAYNIAGELVYMKDQNGTVHDYTRDDLGRLSRDEVSTFGTDIDTTIEAIETTYDNLGRVDKINSYSDYSASDIDNWIQYEYTKLWQVEDFIQDVDGDGSRVADRVVYTYSNETASDFNHSRVSQIKYPDESIIKYSYDPDVPYVGGTASSNDRISRIGVIWEGTDTELVKYDYIGLSMFAKTDLDVPNVQLSRYFTFHGETTAGEYPGFDRFGRVVGQLWVDGGFSHTGSNSFPDEPPIVATSYTYDKDSNRLTAYDERDGNQFPYSQQYTYDDLDRLTEAKRGEWDGSTFTVDKGSQKWALDTLGNWLNIKTDGDGDGTYLDPNEVEDRDTSGSEHNFANELISRDTDDDGTVDIDQVWDKNGNLREIDNNPSGTDDKLIFTHDAWNRLVKVEYKYLDQSQQLQTGTRAVYEYYGNNMRSRKELDSDTTDGTHAVDQERVMYYNAEWQLMEEHIDDESPFTGGVDVDRHMQYVWGMRYIDDLAIRRQDNNTDGDYIDAGDDVWYHLTDVQFSTVAIINDAADLIGRIAYTSYGVSKFFYGDDVNMDGRVTVADSTLITNIANGGNNNIGDTGGYRPSADINRDGVVNGSDTIGSTQSAVPEGQLGPASLDVLVGYDGYIFNPELEQYCVRNRAYDPELGRWIERDPISYTDGSNLYEFVMSNPVNFMDPRGLRSQASGSHQTEKPYIGDCKGKSERWCVLSNWGCSTYHAFELWRKDGYRREAFDAEKRLCGSNQHNNACDAFRHCYWSCLLTVELSSRCAKVVGECHEACGNNKQNEKDMDLYNNARGREFGKICSKKWGRKAEHKCCFDKCKAAMNDGTLQTAPKAPKPQSSLCP